MFFFDDILEKLMSKLKEKKVMKTQGKSWIWDIKDSNSLITSLSIEYKGEFKTLNQKDPMIFYLIFYKLTPQLIKFNIPKTD